MTKQFIMNNFDMAAASHIGHGLWRHPESERQRYLDPDYWIEYAQLLERGFFDTFFLPDSYGLSGTHRGGYATEVQHGTYFPSLDPAIVAAAMGTHTTNLGFALTQSTSFEPPYTVARRLASLDHVLQGRFGWNVVTSVTPGMARNHNQTELLPHDDRYNYADAFMDVAYDLFEGSWEQTGYFRNDGEYYYDPAKVHKINHRSEYFQVEGPFSTEPSPQRTPLLHQAGSSLRGMAFAAKHAEVIFVGLTKIPEIAEFIVRVKEMAEEAGRDPSSLRFVSAVAVVVDETDEVAERRMTSYRENWSAEAALATSATFSGVDLASMDPDSILEFKGTERQQTASKTLMGDSRTVRQVIDSVSRMGAHHPIFYGGAATVADQLEEFAEATGLDGWNIMPLVARVDTRHVVEYLVPELQSRGRMRTAYGTGTLRERLIERGPLLPQNHPGAAHRPGRHPASD